MQQRPEGTHSASLLKHIIFVLCLFLPCEFELSQINKVFLLVNADNKGCVTQYVPRLSAEGVP